MMSNYKIIVKRIGYSNSVLIVNGSDSIIIDTGVKGNMYCYDYLFDQFDLTPEDIKLIILTHTHYDHTGNLIELVKLTGAKVLVHKNEFENLKNGFTPIPNGIGFYTRFITGLGKVFHPTFASPRPFFADIVNEDEMDLHPYGIDGKIISTPGHTDGSQSVILGKSLISGDSFINLQNGIIFPPFVNDPKTLLKTWKRVYDMGIKEIFPGHGSKLKVEDTFQEYEKWKTKLAVKTEPNPVKEYSFESRM